MSDLWLAGILQGLGLIALVWLILGLVGGAEVRRDHEWMSEEWLRRGKR